MAENSPLHIPICHTYANHDDRVVWAKSKPGASFATIPLLVFNILFNEYCKVRFLPTFHHRPVQVAKQSDELDEAEGTTDNLDDAFSSYKPPWMRPTNLESSFVQPLNV